MTVSLWEVDVPAKNSDQAHGRHVHVFVGFADSRLTACKAAHDAYEQALLLYAAGQEIPRSTNWCARGLRPGLELDWERATAGPWADLHPIGTCGSF